MSEMVPFIELTLERGDGHTWMLRFKADSLPQAVDAVFAWFLDTDEFSAKHLGEFLAAIIEEAVGQGIVSNEARDYAAKIIKLIPHLKAPYPTRVNLMRAVVLALIDSPR